MRRYSILLILSALLFACGGKKEETSTPPAAAAQNVSEVVIEGNDQMQFNLKTIEVKEGSTVKLTLKHTGTMAANVMGHNVVILKEGVDLAAFAAKATVAKDNDYIPADEVASIVAYTKVIGGGETVTIEFKAPAKGTYKFLCSFPGHYAMMQGDFIVK